MKVLRSCTFLAILFATCPVSASQYTAAETRRVELEAQLGGSGLIVTVTVLAGPEAKNNHNLIRAVTVSYDDTVINVPSEILERAPNGYFEGVRMAYCEHSAFRLMDLDKGSVTYTQNNGHPCLAITLDFKEVGSRVDAHATSSYMVIELLSGTDITYSTWHFDGYTWSRGIEEY